MLTALLFAATMLFAAPGTAQAHHGWSWVYIDDAPTLNVCRFLGWLEATGNSHYKEWRCVAGVGFWWVTVR